MTAPDRSLMRVAALLAQAESTKNEAEAAAYMEKAQKLSTLYSIDLAKARAADPAKKLTKPTHRKITLGERGTRGLNTYVELFDGIAKANEVKINIAHNSTYVIAFGFDEDIELTEALFRSVLVQMVTASQEFRKSGEWQNDKVYREGRSVYKDRDGKSCNAWRAYTEEWVPGGYRSVTWLTARLEFQNAFAGRIGSRLRQAKIDAVIASQEADDLAASLIPVVDNVPVASAAPGTELVLAEKREAIATYYKQTSNARGSWGGGYASKGADTSRAAGRSAANSARLSGQRAFGGGRKAIS